MMDERRGTDGFDGRRDGRRNGRRGTNRRRRGGTCNAIGTISTIGALDASSLPLGGRQLGNDAITMLVRRPLPIAVFEQSFRGDIVECWIRRDGLLRTGDGRVIVGGDGHFRIHGETDGGGSSTICC